MVFLNPDIRPLPGPRALIRACLPAWPLLLLLYMFSVGVWIGFDAAGFRPCKIDDIYSVSVVPTLGFSVRKQNSKNMLGGNSHQVHVHRVRTTRHRALTTRGDLLARSDSGINSTSASFGSFPSICAFP